MSISPSLAVRNTRPPTTMGDEWPKGTAAFQTTFLAGPKSTGRPAEESTPEPFGPRNRGQSAAGRTVSKRRPGRNRRIDEMITEHGLRRVTSKYPSAHCIRIPTPSLLSLLDHH